MENTIKSSVPKKNMKTITSASSSSLSSSSSSLFTTTTITTPFIPPKPFDHDSVALSPLSLKASMELNPKLDFCTKATETKTRTQAVVGVPSSSSSSSGVLSSDDIIVLSLKGSRNGGNRKLDTSQSVRTLTEHDKQLYQQQQHNHHPSLEVDVGTLPSSLSPSSSSLPTQYHGTSLPITSPNNTTSTKKNIMIRTMRKLLYSRQYQLELACKDGDYDRIKILSTSSITKATTKTTTPITTSASSMMHLHRRHRKTNHDEYDTKHDQNNNNNKLSSAKRTTTPKKKYHHPVIHNDCDTNDDGCYKDMTIIEMKNNDGDTPLHIACSKNYNETVILLLQKGSNVNCINHHNGNTPLHYSCYNNNIEIVKLLIKMYHADYNYKNRNGETPLHCATKNGYVDIVRFLLDTMFNAKRSRITTLRHINQTIINDHSNGIFNTATTNSRGTTGSSNHHHSTTLTNTNHKLNDSGATSVTVPMTQSSSSLAFYDQPEYENDINHVLEVSDNDSDNDIKSDNLHMYDIGNNYNHRQCDKSNKCSHRTHQHHHDIDSLVTNEDGNHVSDNAQHHHMDTSSTTSSITLHDFDGTTTRLNEKSTISNNSYDHNHHVASSSLPISCSNYKMKYAIAEDNDEDHVNTKRQWDKDDTNECDHNDVIDCNDMMTVQKNSINYNNDMIHMNPTTNGIIRHAKEKILGENINNTSSSIQWSSFLSSSSSQPLHHHHNQQQEKRHRHKEYDNKTRSKSERQLGVFSSMPTATTTTTITTTPKTIWTSSKSLSARVLLSLPPRGRIEC